MSKFDDFFDAVKGGTKDLALTTIRDFATSSETDARTFLEDTKDDLRRWTGQLEQGELSTDEFASLLRGRVALAQMAGLTAAGVALTRVQRLREGLTDLVLNTAIDVFL
jgi:hypothetical protein